MIWQRHVTGRLVAYLDRRLPQRDAIEVEAHLNGCAQCQATLDDYVFAADLLRRLPSAPAPEPLWRSIDAAVATRTELGGVRLRGLRTDFRRRGFGRILVYASVLALVLAGAFMYRASSRSTPAAWDVTHVDGSRAARGEWIQTDASSGVRLNVGTIGTVDVGPSSRVRVVRASPDEYRLALSRGDISAVIDAPPRLFFVETPTSTVVDLGCAYTMHVDAEGAGVLRVTSGWASLEWDGRESIVPAGASCRTRKDAGPGTPAFDDATPALKEALTAFDTGERDHDDPALAVVLREARVRDTLTLWHLLSRVHPADRAPVADRIIALSPLPKGMEREQVVALDPATLTRLREELAWSW